MANHLQPCPFCGDEPWFEGDASVWKDDRRYVEMSLGCCARITDMLGWKLARDMTHEARTERLKVKLSDAWNRRTPAEPAAAEGPAVPIGEVVMAVKPPGSSPAWKPYKIIYAPLSWLDKTEVGTKLYAAQPKADTTQPVEPEGDEVTCPHCREAFMVRYREMWDDKADSAPAAAEGVTELAHELWAMAQGPSSVNEACERIEHRLKAFSRPANGDAKDREPQGVASKGAIVDCYTIQAELLGGEIKIQRAGQINGPDLWKVAYFGDVLNKKGQWEWEPMPSGRDDEFLARCRFASAQEAIDAAIASTQEGGSHAPDLESLETGNGNAR